MFTWNNVIHTILNGNPSPDKKVVKTDAEWKEILTAEQYRITRNKGTEVPHSNDMCKSHEIGKYALIGAGAVITKNIKPYALVVGNPAKQIGWVSEYGHRLNFENGKATCKESFQSYELINGYVKKID